MTASLFGEPVQHQQDSGAVAKTAPEPAKPRKRSSLPFHMEKRPDVVYGEKNKEGLYPYERIAERVAKLPARERETVIEILCDIDADDRAEIGKIINWFEQQPKAVQDNYWQAMGR